MDTKTPEQQLVALGLQLPPTPTPKGIYKPCLRVGKYLHISGHGPYMPDGSILKGRVGLDIDEKAGKEAARQTGLAILATVRAELGSLDRVRRVIKILGMVNCVPEFENQPAVINGCSELFALIWGNNDGIGVRSAIGAYTLPMNIPVEIEAQFEVIIDH